MPNLHKVRNSGRGWVLNSWLIPTMSSLGQKEGEEFQEGMDP